MKEFAKFIKIASKESDLTRATLVMFILPFLHFAMFHEEIGGVFSSIVILILVTILNILNILVGSQDLVIKELKGKCNE